MKDNKPMKTLLTLIVFSALFIFANMAIAGSADAGKQKSSACTSCHGFNGKSTNPNNPNLAGQKKNYLAKALKDYRDKKREDAMMNSLTASLSDADIDDLATFFSSVK